MTFVAPILGLSATKCLYKMIVLFVCDNYLLSGVSLRCCPDCFVMYRIYKLIYFSGWNCLVAGPKNSREGDIKQAQCVRIRRNSRVDR